MFIGITYLLGGLLGTFATVFISPAAAILSILVGSVVMIALEVRLNEPQNNNSR